MYYKEKQQHDKFSKRSADLGGLSDPCNIDLLSAAMWPIASKIANTPITTPAQLESTLSEWNSCLLQQSVDVLGESRQKPRAPWMTDRTLGIIAWIAPLRHAIHAGRRRLKYFMTMHILWEMFSMEPK